MCSIVILRQPGATYPLILGGNRDEMAGRPWKPPARHWEDRPDLIGGIDELAGGSWLALNDTGVMAVVLNRMGTLGPEDGKRSRGELVLDALDYADAADAARAMVHLDPAAYRPFNLVIADNRDAFWLTLREGAKRIVAESIPDGLSMVTANDLNDLSSARIRLYRPLFAHAQAPDPEKGDWEAWEKLLGSRIWDGDAGPRGAMCVVTPTGFGTSSSTLLALPNAEHPELKPVFRFCPGRPDETSWQDVNLE